MNVKELEQSGCHTGSGRQPSREGGVKGRGFERRYADCNMCFWDDSQEAVVQPLTKEKIEGWIFVWLSCFLFLGLDRGLELRTGGNRE